MQPTTRSSRFGGVEIRKKSAGRRLRRRPWIYVISAGSVWCPYKKKNWGRRFFIGLHLTHIPAEKEKSFSQQTSGRQYFSFLQRTAQPIGNQ